MAGSKAATLVIRILADVKAAQAGLSGTVGSVKKVEGALGTMALPAGIALGAVALFAKGAASAASDVEQAFGAVESVFKENADQTKALARSASQNVGLATSEYAQMAAVLGAQLKGMGTASDELVGKTDNLIGVGADLAATFGGTTSDAVAAVSSLLRGERDPIEKYGVSIKQADINARLAAQGLDKLTGEAKTQAEAAATLAILTEETADAHGAFAREADTAAGAQQRSAAATMDAKAALGEALLPVILLANQALSGLATWVTNNTELARALIIVVAGVAAAILAANAALKVYNVAQALWAKKQVILSAATKVMAAVQWLLNAAMAANPIGLVVIAIVALIAILVLAYQKSETFRNIVDSAFKVVAAAARLMVAVITGVLGVLGDAFGSLMSAIKSLLAPLGKVLEGPFKAWLAVVKSVISTIQGVFSGLYNFIKGIINKISGVLDGIAGAIDKVTGSLPFMVTPAPPPAAAGRAPAVRGLRPAALAGVSAGGGRGGDVVLVLDGEVFGRATIGALRRFDRRNGPAQVLPRWS